MQTQVHQDPVTSPSISLWGPQHPPQALIEKYGSQIKASLWVDPNGMKTFLESRYDCCSDAKSCPTLCSPVDCRTPASSVLHHLPELLKFKSIESVTPSNHLILSACPLLSHSLFPRLRVFSSKSALGIKWPKYWSFSISPSNEYQVWWYPLFPACPPGLSLGLQKESTGYWCQSLPAWLKDAPTAPAAFHSCWPTSPHHESWLLYNGILLSHKQEWVWVSSNELDEPRADYTEGSKSEREKNIYINTHTHTHAHIYMESRKMVLMNLFSSGEGEGRKNWESIIDIHTLSCVK